MDDGLEFINYMTALKPHNITFNCYVDDMAMSMAFHILQYCSTRHVSKNAYFVHHHSIIITPDNTHHEIKQSYICKQNVCDIKYSIDLESTPAVKKIVLESVKDELKLNKEIAKIMNITLAEMYDMLEFGNLTLGIDDIVKYNLADFIY